MNIRLDENLKQLLKKRNISLNQLARRTNINKSSLHNYLNGSLPQGLKSIIKICKYFDISISELLVGESLIKNTPFVFENQNEERYEVIIKKIKK